MATAMAMLRKRVRVTYFRIHLLYFILLGLVGAIAMIIIEKGKVDFLDCLFMTYSACSLTGLSTIDISTLRTGSLCVLLVMMTLGNQVLMSLVPVIMREYYFRRAFKAAKVEKKAMLAEHLEFRALKTVRWVTTVFYIGIILFFFTILAPYCSLVLTDLFKDRNTNPVWFAFFLTLSAWSNCGFTPWADNVMAFQTDHVVLLSVSILILMGNTMYPVGLRFVIYVLHRMFPNYDPYKFLLRYPRRCCTHLFQGVHTKMLFLCVSIFTLLQYAVMMGFEFNDSLVNLPGAARSLISWFQAVSTRTGGFNAVDMAPLAPTIQLLQAILMYVSSYPLIAGLRQMSEEQRQYVVMDTTHDALADASIDVKKKSQTFAHQVRSKCMGDMWLLSTALFVMTSTEGDHIQQGKFSIFSCIFEVCSAYGTVGLSLGYPGMVTSLSGSFHPISKLAMIVVMLAGRHRGLPRSIDRATNLSAMSGDAEIAADPEVQEYLGAVARACAEVEAQRRLGPAKPQQATAQTAKDSVPPKPVASEVPCSTTPGLDVSLQPVDQEHHSSQDGGAYWSGLHRRADGELSDGSRDEE